MLKFQSKNYQEVHEHELLGSKLTIAEDQSQKILAELENTESIPTEIVYTSINDYIQNLEASDHIIFMSGIDQLSWQDNENTRYFFDSIIYPLLERLKPGGALIINNPDEKYNSISNDYKHREDLSVEEPLYNLFIIKKN